MYKNGWMKNAKKLNKNIYIYNISKDQNSKNERVEKT